MVPELLSRQRVAVGLLAVSALVATALVAAAQPTDGAVSVVAALVLAPFAVGATAVLGGRVAGDRFGIAAGAVYVVLPFLGNRLMLPAYRPTFDAHALPSLVGVQHTVVFAVGIAVAAACVLAPRVLAAAGGLIAFVVTTALWQFGGIGHLPAAFHETVWSVSLVEWLLVAGVLAGLLRAPLWSAAIGGWLLAALLWGAHRGYDGAVFWRSFGIAAPAAALVLSSLVLLVPRLRLAGRRATAPTKH